MSAQPVAGDIPKRFFGFGLGLGFGQADIAQRAGVEPGKRVALPPGVMRQQDTGKKAFGTNALCATAASLGKAGHGRVPFDLMNNECLCIIFLDVYVSFAIIAPMNVFDIIHQDL